MFALENLTAPLKTTNVLYFEMTIPLTGINKSVRRVYVGGYG